MFSPPAWLERSQRLKIGLWTVLLRVWRWTWTMANHQAGRISVRDSEPESGECICCNHRNYLEIKMNCNQQLINTTRPSRRS